MRTTTARRAAAAVALAAALTAGACTDGSRDAAPGATTAPATTAPATTAPATTAPATNAPATTPPVAARPPFARVEDAMRYLAAAYNRNDQRALALVTTPELRADLNRARTRPRIAFLSAAGELAQFRFSEPGGRTFAVQMVVRRTAARGWYASEIAG
ncbi:MAG TPA: hypothetical protein VFQ85_01860 [Mycobacteriales bacterium]|jgi:predicted lipid-binding transport protein (Tim44 family)|nr:hypothetical protein [Mycobacteriales bacterium]